MKRRAPVSTQSISRSVDHATTFADCREALAATIEGLSFVRVVCTQITPAGYTGEAVEILFKESRDKPKLIFFDKFGRNRNQLSLGPIQIVQAPLGLDHASSLPTVGEILVGSLVPNTRKSHLEFVLRGWSSDAKPLQELLRLLKFGTRFHELEVRSSLVQSACLLMQCPEAMRKSRDDIYMTARIILWGNLRPLQVLAALQNEEYILKKPANSEEIEMAKSIKLSFSAIEFIDALLVKWPDVMLSEKFLDGLEHRPKPAWQVPAQAIEPAWKTFTPFQTNYVPTLKEAFSPAAVSHAPQSPAYVPQSPTYMPSSPQSPGNKTPVFELKQTGTLSQLIGSQSPVYEEQE